MIIDKKDGIKIGSKDEAFWSEILEETEKDIERLLKLMKFQESVKEMCSIKLEECLQDGN